MHIAFITFFFYFYHDKLYCNTCFCMNIMWCLVRERAPNVQMLNDFE